MIVRISYKIDIVFSTVSPTLYVYYRDMYLLIFRYEDDVKSFFVVELYNKSMNMSMLIVINKIPINTS